MEIRPSEEDIEQAKRIVNKIIFDYQLDRTTLFTVCNSFNDHISRLICAERIMGEMEKRLKSYDEAMQKEGSEPEINAWYAIRKFDGQGREELVVRQFLENVGWWYSKDITVDWIQKLDFSRQSPSTDAGREWISVKDRLPEEMGWYICQMEPEPDMGTRIDIVFYAIKKYGSMACETGWGEPALCGWANKIVTHWMPLPQPPKG